MKEIEVITHCYSKTMTQYVNALSYQLNSLILYPPKNCKVTITVCCTKDDHAVNWTVGYYSMQTLPSCNIRTSFFPIEELGIRMVGRNYVAKRTKADIVWFADTNYFFGKGLFDELASIMWPEDVTMIYPKTVQISKDHITGDETLNKVREKHSTLDVDPAHYEEQVHGFPIGGTQIVKGDFAREHGYCDKRLKEEGWKVQDIPFTYTHGDGRFRKLCKAHGKLRKVDLPNVFRIRHSETTHV